MTYKLDDFDSEVEMLEKINEQQAIIRRDEMSIKTMMSNMEKLEKENEELKNDFYLLKEIHQKGSKSCEKWKQHKEAQIQQLEKVNEDLREVNKENQLLHEENVKQCDKNYCKIVNVMIYCACEDISPRIFGVGRGRISLVEVCHP